MLCLARPLISSYLFSFDAAPTGLGSFIFFAKFIEFITDQF